MEQGRRLAKVLISTELLIELMTIGWAIPRSSRKNIECISGLPPGASFAGIEFAMIPGYIALIVEHALFDIILPNQEIPTIDVVYESRCLDGLVDMNYAR